MKLVAGRDFDTRDEIMAPVALLAANPTTVIVNQTFVKRYLGERYPLGVHIGFGRDPGTPTPIEIVGVVSDAKSPKPAQRDRAAGVLRVFRRTRRGLHDVQCGLWPRRRGCSRRFAAL